LTPTNCAIQAGTGNVVCWGDDRYGQKTPPNAVNGVSGIATDIAAGQYHSCAIQNIENGEQRQRIADPDLVRAHEHDPHREEQNTQRRQLDHRTASLGTFIAWMRNFEERLLGKDHTFRE
jgi:hypothetical protein